MIMQLTIYEWFVYKLLTAAQITYYKTEFLGKYWTVVFFFHLFLKKQLFYTGVLLISHNGDYRRVKGKKEAEKLKLLVNITQTKKDVSWNAQYEPISPALPPLVCSLLFPVEPVFKLVCTEGQIVVEEHACPEDTSGLPWLHPNWDTNIHTSLLWIWRLQRLQLLPFGCRVGHSLNCYSSKTSCDMFPWCKEHVCYA